MQEDAHPDLMIGQEYTRKSGLKVTVIDSNRYRWRWQASVRLADGKKRWWINREDITAADEPVAVKGQNHDGHERPADC